MDTNTSSLLNIGTYGKVSYQLPGGTDLNTLIYSGIYMGYNLVNAPDTTNQWYHIEVIRHNDGFTVQKAYPFTNSTCPVFIRTQTSGTWNAWRLFNPGTANTAQVLSGYTFSSANGVNLSGSMPNNGALNWSGICTTYTVAAGWYSGGTLDSIPSYNRGVIDADNRVNTYSTNYKTGYNNGYNAGKSAAFFKNALLWTNPSSFPSTSASMNDQSLTISGLSNYNYFVIRYLGDRSGSNSDGDQNVNFAVFCKNNYGIKYYFSSHSINGSRWVRIDSSNTIYIGKSSSASTQNIPTHIYGL